MLVCFFNFDNFLSLVLNQSSTFVLAAMEMWISVLNFIREAEGGYKTFQKLKLKHGNKLSNQNVEHYI